MNETVLDDVMSKEELKTILSQVSNLELKNGSILCVKRTEFTQFEYNQVMLALEKENTVDSRAYLLKMSQARTYFIKEDESNISEQGVTARIGDVLVLDPDAATISYKALNCPNSLYNLKQDYKLNKSDIIKAGNKPGGRDLTYVIYMPVLIKPYMILGVEK